MSDSDSLCMGPSVRPSVCLSVCLTLCLSASTHGISCPIFTIFAHVTYGHGSARLWRRCDMLHISGFVDDVMFVDNGQKGDGNRAYAQCN